MTDIYNPVGGHPRDPFEDIKTQRIGERLSREKFENLPEEKKRLLFHAALIYIMRKMIDLCAATSRKSAATSVKEFVEEDIKPMRKAWSLLKRNDFSQNYEFLYGLSLVWHKLLKDAEYLFADKKDKLAQLVVQYIRAIKRYPEKIEHTLGYYLSEYAGQKWLPFPYMEMLRDLHLQDHTNKSSYLNQWIQLLNDIVRFSEEKLPKNQNSKE